MRITLQPTLLFKCLADETRWQLIMLLIHHGELCVCDFTDLLQVSQPKVSRHLAQLRSSGVLSDSRRGRWVYYRLNPELPDWASQVLQEAFSGNRETMAGLLAKQRSQQLCCE